MARTPRMASRVGAPAALRRPTLPSGRRSRVREFFRTPTLAVAVVVVVVGCGCYLPKAHAFFCLPSTGMTRTTTRHSSIQSSYEPSSGASSSTTALAYRIASVDVDEAMDPEFLEASIVHPFDKNYDNDFDVKAFPREPQPYESCLVVYPKDGLARPFVSNADSQSTFLVYGSDSSVCAPAGMLGQTKEQVANYLKRPSVEVTIALAVLFNCALVAVSTVEAATPWQTPLTLMENFISAVFAVDFFGRWFSSSQDNGQHVLKPQFAVDVVVVLVPLLFGSVLPLLLDEGMTTAWLPSCMTSPSTLINLELLRVLRLRRVLESKESYQRFERALGLSTNVKDWQLQLARVLLSLFTLLSVSAGMIYTVEHNVNPQIKDYFEALYFSLVTLSTVGFGDITPMTWEGKVVVCTSIIAGISVVPPQAAALVEALLARQEEKEYYKGRQQRPSNRRSNSRKGDSRLGSPPSLSSLKSVGSSHNNGDQSSSKMVLETALECPQCGAAMHWSSARYCYSCGEELPEDERK